MRTVVTTGMLLRHEDSRNYWPETYRGGLGWAPRRSMWYVLWPKPHRNRFITEQFGFTLNSFSSTVLVHSLTNWRTADGPVTCHSSTHTHIWTHFTMITIKFLHLHVVGWDSGAGIVNLRAWLSRFRIPTAVRYFSILVQFLKDHEAHPPNYSKSPGDFPEDKAGEVCIWQLTTTCCES